MLISNLVLFSEISKFGEGYVCPRQGVIIQMLISNLMLFSEISKFGEGSLCRRQGVTVLDQIVITPDHLFVLLFLAIVLSVFLRYTDSDCPFGIFKLFL
jgi:hypothetical protein